MGIFNFPGEQEHRTYHHIPIYYDEKEEERKATFGKVDGTLEKESRNEKGEYVPGSYIRGSLREGNYARRKGPTTAQRIIGIVGLVLFFIILVYLVKFYSLL